MSVPVLTPDEVATLKFLALQRTACCRTGTPRKKVTRYFPMVAVEPDAIGCGADPIQDEIEYYDQAVADGIDYELQFTEITDSGWIARSDQIAQRVYDRQEDVSEHWIDNQSKFAYYVQNRTQQRNASYARLHSNTGLSCETMLGRVNAVHKYTRSYANQAIYRAQVRYRADTTRRPGYTAVWHVGQAALGHATHHLNKWSVRRQYMYKQHWGETANAVYHVTRQQPDGIFNLMANAQSLYADIAAGSIQENQVQKQSTLGKVSQVVGIIGTIAAIFKF